MNSITTWLPFSPTWFAGSFTAEPLVSFTKPQAVVGFPTDQQFEFEVGGNSRGSLFDGDGFTVSEVDPGTSNGPSTFGQAGVSLRSAVANSSCAKGSRPKRSFMLLVARRWRVRPLVAARTKRKYQQNGDK